MAGRHFSRLRGGPLTAALAVSFLTSAGDVRAQNPLPPSPPAGPKSGPAAMVSAIRKPKPAGRQSRPVPAVDHPGLSADATREGYASRAA